MTINNIFEAKRELKKEIISNFKRSVFYNFLVICVIVLGGFMFFYVEECYYLVQPVKVLSQRCEEICKDVMKLKNSTFFFYQHNKNTVPQNETIPQNSTVHHQIFEQIVNNCTQKKCIENYQDVQRQCDFDGELYLKWMYFCWIVLRTIGKLYTGNSAKNVKQFYSLLFFLLNIEYFQFTWISFF